MKETTNISWKKGKILFLTDITWITMSNAEILKIPTNFRWVVIELQMKLLFFIGN